LGPEGPSNAEEREMTSAAMKCGFVAALAGLATLPAVAADPVAGAIQSSLTTGVGHAREWLAAGDFKSVSESVGGMQALADLLRARGDAAAWQEAVGKVDAGVKGLQEAVRTGNREACAAALDQLERAAKSASSVPVAGNVQPPQRSSGGLRQLMLLMDGIRADAKVAVLTNRPADAKNAAYVLSELGRVMTLSRPVSYKDAKKWTDVSSGFIDASLRMAQSPAEDGPGVRQLLRDVSLRCDSCHEGR
jgi:hypothetical protein